MPDAFADLARYYDALMETVDYDRWLLVAMTVAELAPAVPFTHLDVACGTGLLAKRLRQHGWPTIGLDLSEAMLRSGRSSDYAPPVVTADMRALPFRNHFGYITCLFDSVNFLIDDGALGAAFRSAKAALHPDGIYYFDIITERMVTHHFDGRKWTEQNGRFQTTWESTYDPATAIADTTIRVNRRQASVIRERIYTLDAVQHALSKAGLHLLGAFDAESWKAPSKKTIRIDVIASASLSPHVEKKLPRLAANVRELLR